jgi:hypothetical protein
MSARTIRAWVVGVFVVAIIAGGVAAAEGGTIHGCVNPSGALFVVDAAADCADNETPIAWSAGGSSSIGFYTVETAFESPGIPDPGGESINWIPSGTVFACDPGDVAVSLSGWAVTQDYAWTGENGPGAPTTNHGAIGEDPVVPQVSTPGEAPNGYVTLRDIPAGSGHWIGMTDDHWAYTQVRHFMVTCADVG